MTTDSFKKTFLPLHPKLYRVALALIGNKNDAEDILQEAYCKLWNKRMELTTIHNYEAFSVTLVKNLCLDFLRSAQANRHEIAIEEINLIHNESPPPDKELEKKEKMKQIQLLIEQLPENQKQVLKLKGFDDCSLEEIEEITGLSAVNIRTLLSRARKTIREQYINKIIRYER